MKTNHPKLTAPHAGFMRHKLLCALGAFLPWCWLFLPSSFAAADEPYPLAPLVARWQQESRGAVRPTGANSKDYLRVAEGVVKFFRAHQNESGAIIDPYEKQERQYATPAFACAAAALVASGMTPELREPGERAFRWAATQLAKKQGADHHEDFYTVLLMHAREMMKPQPDIPPFDPEATYRSRGKPAVNNWNVVGLSGEFLRFQAGMTPDNSFAEKYLEYQVQRFNEFGMYHDPNDPMAYDLFPRLWLTDMLFHGYQGRYRKALEELLTRGALTSLFMQSPRGELPAGGRSAAHQWNEAQQAATYEMMARQFAGRGDARLAGAFKRAAHLALLSMRRWERPSGELWIVKNRFPPEQRFGYERYSFHSQYNLLAVAMLAIAWRHADESAREGAAPAETGGFAFAVRSGFDKVFANAGGAYVEYDLNADAHYNPTGILRVHFPQAALLSEGAVVHPNYGTAAHKPSRSLALGPAWEAGGKRFALADRERQQQDRAVVAFGRQTADLVEFTVRYENGGCPVTEQVSVRPNGLRLRSEAACATRIAYTVPFLVFDGEREPDEPPRARALTRGAAVRRLNLREPSRNGLLDALEISAAGKQVEIELHPAAVKSVKTTETQRTRSSRRG